jgi:hypothetical protein
MRVTRTKSNELVCHVLHNLPQILRLTEHYLTNLEIHTQYIDTIVENILNACLLMDV